MVASEGTVCMEVARMGWAGAGAPAVERHNLKMCLRLMVLGWIQGRKRWQIRTRGKEGRDSKNRPLLYWRVSEYMGVTPPHFMKRRNSTARQRKNGHLSGQTIHAPAS